MMASLRQTRRFSYTATPPPGPQRQEAYQHSSPSPDVITLSNTSRDTDRPKVGGVRQAKSVRKVKSQATVGSSNFDEHRGSDNDEHQEFASPVSDRELGVEEKSSAIDSRGRKKKHRRSTRSQSARPRDQSDWEEEVHDTSPTRQTLSSANAIHGILSSHAPPSNFLVPKSRTRSRSRSPSPMPSSTITHEGSLSEDVGNEPRNFKARSKGRSNGVPKPKSRASIEEVFAQPQRRPSRLRAPTSRAISPLPPLTPTLNLPDDNSVSSAEMASRSPSPAARPQSSMSSLSLKTRREASRTPSDALSHLPSRARSQSRAVEASPSPIFSPPPPTVPRTLKDVTRRLEENRGRLKRDDSSHSESEFRYDNASKPASPSSTPTPSRHQISFVETDLSGSLASEDTKRQPRMERLRQAHPKPKYGLALTAESGTVLGEIPVENVRSFQTPNRTMPPEGLPRVFSPSTTVFSTRPATVASSNNLAASDGTPLERNNIGATSEVTPSIRIPKPRHGEKVSTEVSRTTSRPDSVVSRDRGRSRNPLPPSRPEAPIDNQLIQDQPQVTSSHEPRAVPRPEVSATAGAQTYSSPSSLPRPFSRPTLISRHPSTPSPARSAIPSFPTPRPSRIEASFSHNPSGSDSSAHSLPRAPKLVIRNPDLSDRPSSSSSSNPETPISTTATTSQEFTSLALSSASQIGVGDHGKDGNYIVPDDVAAAVTNEEERRRKALAGLVHGLHLGSSDQAARRPTNRQSQDQRARQTPTTPRTPWDLQKGQHDDVDDDDDDDAFFSRISTHDDESSLLEEPEPEAEAGFMEDEDDFDEDSFGSPREYDTEDEEKIEDDPPLPPTPKFVHPLEEGDDLESRITRVASLHRISTAAFSSLPRGQDLDRHTRAQPESKNEGATLLTKDEGRYKGVRSVIMQSSFDEPEHQRTSERAPRAEDRSKGKQVETRPDAAKGRETSRSASPAPTQRRDRLSSSQSQSSNFMTDSELSSVGGGRLSDAGSGTEGTLSSGAEALFRQLQVEADAREAGNIGRGKNASSDLHSDGTGKASSHEEHSSSRTGDDPSNHLNYSTIRHVEPGALRTWRSTLPPGAYDSLAERHGPSEMRRQEIIWELCETEQAFVKSLRLILRLFVQPLRHEDKTWITGVPRDVTRLFDWFDDIMHLHSQISSALHAARSAQYPVVIQIAETLRPFVPRLELHQPYLVRLESVSSAVEAMSKDMQSDFGEFVRIQTASPECESMNLPSFLLKPVQRLMKYPLFFKQLWDLTPRSHPDHLPTFSLLHSTDMIIRVMQEVKAREEEYELVKNLASRIKGLPIGFQLARRERRLVAQGLLRRIILSDKERLALDSSINTREPRGSQTTSISRITSASSDNSSFTGNWAYHPNKTGAMPTSETDRSLRAESVASDATLDSQHSQSKSSSRSSSLRGSLRHKSKENSVYAFIFTDMMILTTPISERHILRSPKTVPEGKETWRLMDDVGVSRVLGVTDQSGRLSTYDHLIAVELMSMAPNLLDTGVFSDGDMAIPVYLSILDQRLSATEDAAEALSEAKAKWLDAFERCFRFTLRSLSFPSYVGSHVVSGGGTDLDLDTKSSVMSILASGLPLPMSPSQQLGEAQRGRRTDLVQEEREERGWWSLRFQQVLKEVQRSSRSPVLDAAPSRKNDTRSKRQGGKRSETRPLILSPTPSNTSSRKGGILSLGRKKSK